MTRRERIADWISGGALTHYRSLWLRTKTKYFDELSRRQAVIADRHARERALRAIIERGNTASPNSTVKAMVRIAREGIE